MFDHEKLQVYQLQLEFIGWVTPVLHEAQQRDAALSAEVRRQLDRASLSTLLNVAEGNGKRRQQTRVKSLDDARGSATESAACLDALVAKGLLTVNRVEDGKHMLERVYAMLTKLMERFDRRSSSASSSSPSSSSSSSSSTKRR